MSQNVALDSGICMSNNLGANNVYSLLEECLAQHGKPEIINSDQGVQYTSHKWVSMLETAGIRISMDGRGRCKDNYYNYKRPHQSPPEVLPARQYGIVVAT